MWHNPEVFFYIVIVVVAFYAFIRYANKSRIQTVIISDNCNECPFKREYGQRYGCSLMEPGRSFPSPEDMNNDCEVGNKLEITVSKQK